MIVIRKKTIIPYLVFSGLSIDSLVLIEAEDKEGMQRLVEYISRCHFSLTRMITPQSYSGKFTL